MASKKKEINTRDWRAVYAALVPPEGRQKIARAMASEGLSIGKIAVALRVTANEALRLLEDP